MDSLSETARAAVDSLRRGAPSAAAEVYLYRRESRSLELREGRLHARQEGTESGMGLRLFDGGRMAFASSGGLDEDCLDRILGMARDQLRFLAADELRSLPEPIEDPCPDPGLVPTLRDDSIFREPFGSRLEGMLALQADILRSDPRVSKVIELSRGESRVEVAVASTSGVRCCESGTISSSGASVMAAKGSEVQVGSGMSWARFQDALEPSRAGRDAVLRAVSLLGARKPPSRRRSVLWDPWIAGDFLDIVAGALSAEAVQRGRSLFQGKLGARVASPLVTFVDDPRRPGGMASFLRDDEGMPTSRKEMVKDGILMDFFFDSYTARKAGRLSNGCATRSGYKGLPGPGSSNFFLAPGVSRREDLIAGTRDGILAFELLGMHTADPISGEFSAGVGGIAIEGGELAYPVKNAMISGNVVDLLSRVDAVCGDLTFHGCLAAPTFRVADVMVC